MFLVVTANLTDKVVEGPLDVDAGLGGRLDELAAKLLGQGLTLYNSVKRIRVSRSAP